jgi:hypothetical protein
MPIEIEEVEVWEWVPGEGMMRVTEGGYSTDLTLDDLPIDCREDTQYREDAPRSERHTEPGSFEFPWAAIWRAA